MRWMFLFLLLLLLVSPVSSAAESSPVTVIAADGRAVALSPSELARLPLQTATATLRNKTISVEGYDLRAVLGAAGIAVEALHGRQLAATVAVTGADGYKVVFGLAELDRTLGNTRVLLTRTEPGNAAATEGAWRLVVPGDQRPARWVRQVTSIRVSE